MNKILITLLFIFSTTAFGQESTKGFETQHPENEEFSIELPGRFGIYTPNDDHKLLKYGNASESVGVVVISSPKDSNIKQTIVEDFAKQYAKAKKAKIGGITVRTYRFVENGFEHELVFAASSTLNYSFHIYEKGQISDKYAGVFKTIKFGGKNPKPKPLLIGTGSGMGGGSGNGYNPNFRPVVITEQRKLSPQPQIASLYLFPTRLYAKIQFKADGTIGTIKTEDLPFGLAEMVKSTASKIKFNPARSDGVPVDQELEIAFTFQN